jgi:hypothetical protein
LGIAKVSDGFCGVCYQLSLLDELDRPLLGR